MSWAAPLFLWLMLLPLGAAVLLRRRSDVRPATRWRAMLRVAVSGSQLRAIGVSRLRPGYISLLAIALATVALARPLWGESDDGAFTSSREVMVAMDLSRSMLAIDVEPNRLTFAHELTTQLLDALTGERVGLIVFAGTSFVQVPLSPDYQIIREFLPLLDPEYMPQGGSDYTGMLQAALEGFGERDDADRYLIVLSDGESTTEGWQEKLDALAERRVHVLAVGIGTEAGGFLDNGYGGYYKDQDGGVIQSKLQPATLQALAKRTDGEYLNPADVAQAVTTLVDAVQSGRQGKFEGDVSAGGSERFQWFLLPAIVLALAGLLMEFRLRPTPREIQRRKPGVSALAVAVPLVLLASMTPSPASAHFDNQAEFEVREVFDSNPTERLRAIVRHLAEFDYDAYDLRLMVEETLKYGLDEQRLGLQPAEGVIRDAIAATEQGEALDSSVADWSFYRARLEALLVQPEAEAEENKADERPPTPLDEEDTPPMVAGQSTQSSATDSFGQGASAKTDASLGDLTPSEDVQAKRGEPKPPPPKSARMAALRASRGDSGGGNDPIMAFSRKRMEEANKRDSPGRLHQLLAETAEQQEPPQQDW